jgi:hypothetical protein
MKGPLCWGLVLGEYPQIYFQYHFHREISQRCASQLLELSCNRSEHTKMKLVAHRCVLKPLWAPCIRESAAQVSFSHLCPCHLFSAPCALWMQDSWPALSDSQAWWALQDGKVRTCAHTPGWIWTSAPSYSIFQSVRCLLPAEIPYENTKPLQGITLCTSEGQMLLSSPFS